MSDYNDYLAEEWRMFEADDEHQNAVLQAAKHIEVNKVLDLACGAGQEMLPFVRSGAFGFGLDYAPQVGQIGRVMFDKSGHAGSVYFLRGSGDAIPFADASFDVVICRIALMYMNAKRALAEIARVLRSGGVLFLKVHAPRYYWRKFGDGIKTGQALSSVHAARVLFAGNWFRFAGNQLFNKLTAGGETFLDERILRRELEPLGLQITGELSDTNKLTPSFIITKA